ncbi:site-specific integrase [Thiomicrorhabdus sp. Milos-T2]|uniref:site-specific integrase n=1 Tax=Thiomicrorhabdus sp. Milos-T2 TaxID=90814 RepID=UPI0004947CBA|nr:site-specific integrase [Thiomicrorhabdus sp. Milos-T2]
MTTEINSITIEEYSKRCLALIKEFEVKTGYAFENHQNNFLVWLDIKSNTLSPATNRLYRSAVQYCFKHFFDIDVLSLNSNFMQSGVSKKQIRAKFGKRTSAKKAKSIDLKTWNLLKPVLKVSKSAHAKLALHILQASKVFGLRPVEWAYAEMIYLSRDDYALKVKNAKATQGRSFGKFRTVEFNTSSLEKEELDLVEGIKSADWLINFFSSTGLNNNPEAYRKYVDVQLIKSRQYLNQLFRKNNRLKSVPINKRISLYSARHQFAADAKRNGLSSIEIAALMGHGSVETNGKFYGRKINGKHDFFVKAATEDVLKISSKTSHQSFVPNSN